MAELPEADDVVNSTPLHVVREITSKRVTLLQKDDVERSTKIDTAFPQSRFSIVRDKCEQEPSILLTNLEQREMLNDPITRVIHLSAIAAAVSPLYRFFSFPVRHNKKTTGLDLPSCVRCPNCKGCQLHMQFCSGAYGMRHILAWIVRRRPPKMGESRRIALFSTAANSEVSALPTRHVCRFEVGPVVITRHIIHTSREQTIETLQRGGRSGPFAGMVCPRPLNFLDIFFGIFHGTTQRGKEKKNYHILQHTAMRAVAAQARALWEKLTFSPEKASTMLSNDMNIKNDDSFFPLPLPLPSSQRVPIGWRCPPFFFSLEPCAPVGNRGLTFRLWLPEVGRHIITSYVIEDGEFWKSKHTCSFDEENAEEGVDMSSAKWEGDVRCRRCYAPGICWGLICRRHREERDKMITVLRVRRACAKRRVARRAIMRNEDNERGIDRNDVAWVNKHKTRAQFMALLVAYMMRTTVCGPYKQRRLTPHSSTCPTFT